MLLMMLNDQAESPMLWHNALKLGLTNHQLENHALVKHRLGSEALAAYLGVPTSFDECAPHAHTHLASETFHPMPYTLQQIQNEFLPHAPFLVMHGRVYLIIDN